MDNRRTFLAKASGGFLGLSIANLSSTSWFQNEAQLSSIYPTGPLEQVRAVVGAAHANFDLVKELVDNQPELAKASYDWGFGDWESALGAAAHMGRKDIAEYLMENGARPNLFTWAMLGKLNVVKSIIETNQDIRKLHGPHGFNLMHHATIRINRKMLEGSELARQEELVTYLEEVGECDTRQASLPISEDEKNEYLGKYPFGSGDDEFFEVTLNRRGLLSLQRGSFFGRVLNKIAPDTFAPSGAPSVRIVFGRLGGKVNSVTIHNPTPIVTAKMT